MRVTSRYAASAPFLIPTSSIPIEWPVNAPAAWPASSSYPRPSPDEGAARSRRGGGRRARRHGAGVVHGVFSWIDDARVRLLLHGVAPAGERRARPLRLRRPVVRRAGAAAHVEQRARDLHPESADDV